MTIPSDPLGSIPRTPEWAPQERGRSDPTLGPLMAVTVASDNVGGG